MYYLATALCLFNGCLIGIELIVLNKPEGGQLLYNGNACGVHVISINESVK